VLTAPRDLGALVLLLIGPFMLMIGWIVGVLLLWTSDRWTRGEKLLGTLVWPLAYAVALAGDYVFFLPLWLTLLVSGLITIAGVVVLARTARPGRAGTTQSSEASTTPIASGNS
jgi:hypothetical protein